MLLPLIEATMQKYFLDLGLSAELGRIEPSNRPELADYQCNGAMGGAKILKTNPKTLAEKIIKEIENLFPEVEFSLAGGGFINLKLKDAALLKMLDNNLEVSLEDKKVVIDFGGPNVAKGMHVGHLRSSLIGAALVEIHRYKGHKTTGDNHLGDWGTPIGIVITEIKKVPSFNWSLENIETLYVKGAKQYKEEGQEDYKKEVQATTKKLQSRDAEITPFWTQLVATTIKSLKSDYEELGITFDLWLGESHFDSLIPKMIQELKTLEVAQDSEGAVVIPLENSPSLILQKSNGTYLYHTTDLACVKERSSEFEELLYVVDKRQALHFSQVFEAAHKVNYLNPQVKAKHIAFGTINGSDAKPFKTRDGGVLKLKDLIQLVKNAAKSKLEELGVTYSETEQEEITKKVGIGALKFAELKHNRTSDYVFDLDKFLSLEGYTGPYVMYSALRAKGILNKAQLKAGEFSTHQLSAEERKLVLVLTKFNSSFELALSKNEPHHLCDYSYQLATAFNNFYHHTKVLKEVDIKLQAHYLSLVELSFKTLETTLKLLGIHLPPRM